MLEDGKLFLTDALAAGTVGIMTTVAMQPFVSLHHLKTAFPSTSTLKLVAEQVKSGGMLRLFNGAGETALLLLPRTTVTFSMREYFRKQRLTELYEPFELIRSNIFSGGFAGCWYQIFFPFFNDPVFTYKPPLIRYHIAVLPEMFMFRGLSFGLYDSFLDLYDVEKFHNTAISRIGAKLCAASIYSFLAVKLASPFGIFREAFLDDAAVKEKRNVSYVIRQIRKQHGFFKNIFQSNKVQIAQTALTIVLFDEGRKLLSKSFN